MHIITGLDYYSKIHQTIQDMIKEAQKNPYENYIFITKTPLVFEKIFFQYTPYLINIEIMTWQRFLQKQQTLYHYTSHHLCSKTEMMYSYITTDINRKTCFINERNGSFYDGLPK